MTRDRAVTVVAVGGNALVRRGGPDDVASEQAAARAAAGALAGLGGAGGLVVTHGNGPQVGMLALGAEATGRHVPLHVLDAQSQGHIGHLLQVELARGGAAVCTLLTHVEVDPADPAFAEPTKPIGPVLDERRARELAAERGWTVAPDGPHWRRVVASPEPLRVMELDAVRRLLTGGWTVLCAGGGGIPVAVGADGGWQGVEAVVDKDLTTALVAVGLDADRLVLLTDVDAVHRGWGTAAASPIATAPVAELRALRFEPGTMAPKVEAACRFVERTGRPATIGALDRARAVAAGESGTTVVP